ncbi:MAG: hypothetical protein EP299_12500 [Acidobacteria bacterium]|nr:MAG: hypothetical protein EP299_12500 [Acidobacteriota bacterium]
MQHDNVRNGDLSTVKTIGSSGQIALGKQYAGRHVLVDQVEPGVWVIKLGQFIPDSEQWLHEPETSDQLERAVKWAEEHEASETDLDSIEQELLDK